MGMVGQDRWPSKRKSVIVNERMQERVYTICLVLFVRFVVLEDNYNQFEHVQVGIQKKSLDLCQVFSSLIKDNVSTR